jgi:hypothetical protein
MSLECVVLSTGIGGIFEALIKGSRWRKVVEIVVSKRFRGSNKESGMRIGVLLKRGAAVTCGR